MRVMVIVKATKDSEAGALPPEGLLAEMMKYNEELVKAGIMLAGDGLKPSSTGKRVKFSGASRTVVDGPFAETKELIAGYWLWQVNRWRRRSSGSSAAPTPCPATRRSKSGALRDHGLSRGHSRDPGQGKGAECEDRRSRATIGDDRLASFARGQVWERQWHRRATESGRLRCRSHPGT